MITNKINIMKKKSILLKLSVCALLLKTVVSCTKEPNSNYSFARYISESEQLAIPAEIELPANLPEGNKRVATYFATGVQQYKAQQVPGSEPVRYRWLLVAPKAILFDITNSKVGTHTIGPTWQLSASDSIYGQQFYPARSVTPDSTSIAWLLLKTKDGKTPTGVFAGVSYIQRIATTGGKAPSIPPVSISDTVDVNYTAIYRFTKKNF
jgi:hypothetical protein